MKHRPRLTDQYSRPKDPKEIGWVLWRWVKATGLCGRTDLRAYLATNPQNVRERPKHNIDAMDPNIPINSTGFLPNRSDSLFQCSTVIVNVTQ